MHYNVGLKCFFSILAKCLLLLLYIHLIDISQGSVETHSRCVGICNNYVIAKLPAECASQIILKIDQ